MPQLQAGQVLAGSTGLAPKPYGTVKQENVILFQEKVMKLFKPFEYVTVKNITDAPIYWQYMPPENETELFSEDGYQKMIQRTEPEFWGLMPGETDTIVGGCAYRMLDVLYKAYAATRTLKRFSDPNSPQFSEEGKHMPKNFNFSDGGIQDEVVEIALLGKAVPTFQGQPLQPAMQAQPGQALPMQQSYGNHYDPNAPLKPLTQQPNFQPAAPMQPQPVMAGQPPAPFPQNGPAPAPTHTAPEVDPNVPTPKTTEGAPLEEPVYATPEGSVESETVEEQPKTSTLRAARKAAGAGVGGSSK